MKVYVRHTYDGFKEKAFVGDVDWKELDNLQDFLKETGVISEGEEYSGNRIGVFRELVVDGNELVCVIGYDNE